MYYVIYKKDQLTNVYSVDELVQLENDTETSNKSDSLHGQMQFIEYVNASLFENCRDSENFTQEYKTETIDETPVRLKYGDFLKLYDNPAGTHNNSLIDCTVDSIKRLEDSQASRVISIIDSIHQVNVTLEFIHVNTTLSNPIVSQLGFWMLNMVGKWIALQIDGGEVAKSLATTGLTEPFITNNKKTTARQTEVAIPSINTTNTADNRDDCTSIDYNDVVNDEICIGLTTPHNIMLYIKSYINPISKLN